MPSALVATLGAEPQIIPLATSLLLAREPLDAGIVLHTAAQREPVASALPAPQRAFGLSPDVGLTREVLRREFGGLAEKDRSWLP